MNTYDNALEVEQTLALLGSNSLDLSTQPQTFKGITKKLNTIVKDLNSFEVIVPPGLSEVDKQIANVKSDIPEWAFTSEVPGDGRVASPEEKEQAMLTLDELEEYINSASTENLMDIHCALVQSLVICNEQMYKFDKLEDYRHHIQSTRLVSKDTHRSLSQLGMGMESSLPDITLFTNTPSTVNYGSIEATLEDKSSALSTLLKILGSLGITVLMTVALNYLLRFAFWLAEFIEKKIKGYFNRDKKATETKKRVKTSRYTYKREQYTSGQSPESRANDVFKYAPNVNLTVDEISLAGLYRDTAKGRLKESEIDDLYAATAGNNIKDLKSLWQTMQDVLNSVDKSLQDTNMALSTMKTTQSINDPVIDPSTLEASLVTVHRIEESFKTYEDPKVDVQKGLEIIKEVAQIYGKGDLGAFEKRLNHIKKHIADLDKMFNNRQKEKDMTEEMRQFLMKRIYLLKTCTEYLSNNMKLQTRIQTLAIRHAKIFAQNLESIEAFEIEMDKTPDEGELGGAQPA